MELQEIKKYLRISHSFDDDYIQSLIDMSKDYIKEQTGVEYRATDFVYRQAVMLMIAHFYDNKSAVTEKAVYSVPYSLDTLIRHIGARVDA